MKRKSRSTHLALFGNVGLIKSLCADCDSVSLVIDGKFQCCDRKFNKSVNKCRRVTQPEPHRRYPTSNEKRRVLFLQEYKCIYCAKTFDSMLWRQGKLIRLKAYWDHFMPFAYSQNNDSLNFVAACQICNLFKGNKMFQTLKEAQDYIVSRWELEND